jgi:predicted nucleotidyltransferase
MKQLKNIARLKKIFPIVKGIEVALLYGSFGRNEPSPNSDIDIQVLVNDEFENKFLMDELQKEFYSEIFTIREVALRNKFVAYFEAQPKIEFTICRDISEINRNYLGSEIVDIHNTILYEKQGSKYEIASYLQKLVDEYNRNKTLQVSEKQVIDLADKFVYEFESCSYLHRRCDGYQFYYFYNIALQTAIQINYLVNGHSKFSFLPKNFIAKFLAKEEQNSFYDLKGTLFLPEANLQKRRLLDFFYKSIQNLVSIEKQTELKHFCETIYNRDFIWNFRDISLHNPKIKNGLIFRTSMMTLFQNESFFESFINEKNIKTVIDLRAEKEVLESNYTENSLNLFAWVHTPFNPWKQSIEFQTMHHQGTNIEIAYRFFAMECKQEIKQAVEAILREENAIAIHCFAGKDRTGVFISMLHLLSGADLEIVYRDYLATEMDTNKKYLDVALDVIKQKNGIENYLLSCGLSNEQIKELKTKLLNEN